LTVLPDLFIFKDSSRHCVEIPCRGPFRGSVVRQSVSRVTEAILPSWRTHHCSIKDFIEQFPEYFGDFCGSSHRRVSILLQQSSQDDKADVAVADCEFPFFYSEPISKVLALDHCQLVFCVSKPF